VIFLFAAGPTFNLNTIAMIQSFINTGIRNFRKYRLYAFINIFGLSLGVCTAICIFLYVADELSYDRFHDQGEDTYRVNAIYRYDENETKYSTTSATLAEFIRPEIPEVKHVARVYHRQGSIEVVGNKTSQKKFREENLYLADPDVFNLFTFTFLKGDATSSLKNPNQVVLSRKTAVKYFDSVDQAIGKELVFEGSVPLTVSGVVEDFPQQSHIRPEVILHFENFYTLESEEIRQYLHSDWTYNPVTTYVTLKHGTAVNTVFSKFNALQKKHGDERAAKNIHYELQPLYDIHLYSHFTYEESPNIRYIYILSSIGILILIVACVNFINLSTVHSLKRSREIGVRKVLGADKRSLVIQFLSESAFVVCLSFTFAIVFLYLLLPFINQVSGKMLHFNVLLEVKIILGILALFILTTLFAGLYPSFFITRFKPTEVLKGISANATSKGYWLRKTLVVFQFTISVVLVALAFLFHQQMLFIKDKPLGFERDNILTIPLFSDSPNSILGGGVDGPLRARMNAFEQEVIDNLIADAVTVSSGYPGAGVSSALVQTDKIREQDNVFISATSVDYDFLDTYKMELVAGRSFSREAGTDHLQAFIINEQAVKKLGWTNEDAIGQRVAMLGKEGAVIGVVRDFHFQGLQQSLQPLILEVSASKFTIFSLRLNSKRSVQRSIDEIKVAWDKIFPEKVFEYHFLDDRLQEAYGREQRLTGLMQFFSLLAIVISALGLFGLAAYINHQRIKEISIRKVLGANTKQIFAILGKEFLQMAAIAFLLGIPLAYILGNSWLDSFAYKIAMGVLPFILGGLVILVTVVATVSYETIKAAMVNPADKLRSE
jgi:putative ABC transport system permease protein